MLGANWKSLDIGKMLATKFTMCQLYVEMLFIGQV